MEAIHYVITAGAVVWIGLGAYIFRLSLYQQKLSTRLRQLEIIEGNSHDQTI